LEDEHEGLLKLAETHDFEHSDQANSIALVGDQVRDFFASSVLGPLLTTANQYVRAKLDAAQPKAADAGKNGDEPFPVFPPPPSPDLAVQADHALSGGGPDHR
jgi:hypothetical protein